MKPLLLLALLLLPAPVAAASIHFSLCTGSTFTMTVDGVGVPRGPFAGSVCGFPYGDPVTHPTLQAQIHTDPGEAFAPLTLAGWRQYDNGGVLWSGGAEVFYVWVLYLGGGDLTYPPMWTTWTGTFALPASDPITVEITQHPVAHSPEPLTLVLMGATLVTVGWVARRRRR